MIAESLYNYIDKQKVIERPVDVPRETVETSIEIEKPIETSIEAVEGLSSDGIDLNIMMPEDVIVDGELIKIEQSAGELLGQFDSRIESIIEALSEL